MRTARLEMLLLMLAVIALVSFGCGGDDDDDAGDDDSGDDDDSVSDDDDDASDDDDDDDDDNDTSFDEPYDPTDLGPYEVGNRTFLFVDENRVDRVSRGYRKLLTEVWYPAPKNAVELPANTVRSFMEPWSDFIKTILALLLPPEELENLEAETGSYRNAPLETRGGPYPIVMMSHGNAAIRFAYWSLAEYLASHGYIVISPDHIGNAVFVTLPDRLQIYNPIHMPVSAVYRVMDLWFLTDLFTELNDFDPEGLFTGMIDTESIGVVGHSLGGVTGSEWAILDPRVTAAVDMGAFFIPIFPANFNAALMVMVGSEDRTMGDWTPFTKIFHRISPTPKYWLEVFDGGHYTFSDACDLIPTLMGEGDGCGIGHRKDTGEEFDYLDQETGFAIMNSYITAMFGYHLKGRDSMLDDLITNRFPDEMDLIAVPGK
jgi:dienelactone hydrolase